MTWDEAKPIVEAIPGFLVPGQEEYLFNKVKSLPPRAVVVEVGAYCGRSTLAMGLAMIDTGQHLYSIDLEIRKELIGVASAAVGHIDATRGYSHQILALWSDKSADMFFIDGSHTLPNVLLDIAEAYRILKPGGWIVVHDFDSEFPDVIAAWGALNHLFAVDQEVCHTIRAGRKSYVPHDTP